MTKPPQPTTPPRPDHATLVAMLSKPGAEILASLDVEKCNIMHHASCIPSEAGELFDAVKKHIFYEKPIDRANVVEELGDLEFYMEGLRKALGITREETLEANIDKLSERYKGLAYSNTAAQARADKSVERIETCPYPERSKIRAFELDEKMIECGISVGDEFFIMVATDTFVKFCRTSMDDNPMMWIKDKINGWASFRDCFTLIG